MKKANRASRDRRRLHISRARDLALGFGELVRLDGFTTSEPPSVYNYFFAVLGQTLKDRCS